jgi:hypothetical protein
MCNIYFKIERAYRGQVYDLKVYINTKYKSLLLTT